MFSRKLSLTLGLLQQLPEDKQEPRDQAMKTWWVNIRPQGGLRLTEHGYYIMHDVLELESWVLDLSDGNATQSSRITKKIILDLDRKLEWPYYIDFNARKKRHRIVLFGSREAMMAAMYGDLEAWLRSKKNYRYK
jgi:hypothetical protein